MQTDMSMRVTCEVLAIFFNAYMFFLYLSCGQYYMHGAIYSIQYDSTVYSFPLNSQSSLDELYDKAKQPTEHISLMTWLHLSN